MLVERAKTFLPVFFHFPDLLVCFVQRFTNRFYQILDRFLTFFELVAGLFVQSPEAGFRQLEEFTAAGFHDVAGQCLERVFKLTARSFEGLQFFFCRPMFTFKLCGHAYIFFTQGRDSALCAGAGKQPADQSGEQYTDKNNDPGYFHRCMIPNLPVIRCPRC